MSTQDAEPLPKLEPYKMAVPKPRLTAEERETLKKPKVIIVGAGIGGLTLGILLQKGNIPYLIVERAKEVKPLGSSMALGANLNSLLIQLGLLDEFKAIGKLCTQLQVLNEDLQPEFVMDFTERIAITGGQEMIVSRADLYALLLRQIPKENILMNKKVLSFLQGENGVMIRCSDDSTYDGDILVGADGAYSAVRQHMYAALKKESRLPSSDDVALPFSSVCLVGQTEVLDPEEFPDLKLPLSQFFTVLGSDKIYSHLNEDSSKLNDSFRNSEWGPEAAEAMCKEVRHLKVPGGYDDKVRTIGDLIDKTPKDLISKVMLEEKVFDTWYDRRTVLLGDACHKLNPAGGAGAQTAIQDAIALANWICAVQSREMDDIEAALKEYQNERVPIAKETFETSRMFTNIAGKGFAAKLTRGMMSRIPHWLWVRLMTKMSLSRPQATFLPLIAETGSATPKYGASYHKTLAIQQKREKANPQNPGPVV
ncbi:hypothetical protein CPB97_002859 [Podila verticillata]|nr:hypothetical protein CPB97_002859 [Podila verticillata]